MSPPPRLSTNNPLYITPPSMAIFSASIFYLARFPPPLFPSLFFFAFFFLWELMMPNLRCLLFISPNYPYPLNFCFLITMSTGKEPFANWYWEEDRMNKNKEKSYLVYFPLAYRYHLWSLLRTRLMTDPDLLSPCFVSMRVLEMPWIYLARHTHTAFPCISRILSEVFSM